jgi:DNA-binding transcriptional ArsR family regulator
MVDPRLFQALSDATRLEILSVLAAGPINVSKIVAHVGCAQPAVSRHLRVLREVSLIHDRRRGKEVEYSINGRVLLAAVEHLNGLAGEAASSRASGVRSDEARAVSRSAVSKSAATGISKRAAAERGAVGEWTRPVRSAPGPMGGGRRGSGKGAGCRRKAGRAGAGSRGSASDATPKAPSVSRAGVGPDDSGSSEFTYTVERRPSGMDDFLL